MKAKTDLLYAGLSDTGRARRENEDRIYMDGDRGLFVVADGLGGHAAGERAAETAVEMIKTRLERKIGSPEDRMREAITVANNEIHTQAEEHAEWNGMACVVTIALVEDGRVTVGHVGDSRLYALEPGSIRKVTLDHSPVGELEDSGRLSEASAMAHPRRNEVFRDLGSELHGPDDDDFIDILTFPFRPSMALLICSDGLSDQVGSADIRGIIEARAQDPDAAVSALVQAANDAGGKDNVSVVLVEGPGYRVAALAPPPASVLAPRAEPRGIRWGQAALFFLAGLLTAGLAFGLLRPYLIETQAGTILRFGSAREVATWKVGAGGLATIGEALAKAQPGDTVLVEPGTYHETIRLRSGVALLSARRRHTILEADETVVLSESVQHARLVGFVLKGPAVVGIRILNSDLEVTDNEITGMREAGIDIDAESSALIRANHVTGNPGNGIVVRGAARPAITNNTITGNGKTPGDARSGIYIAGGAVPVVSGNLISDNGVEQIWVSPLFPKPETLAANNLISPGVKDRRNLVKVVTR
jgi:parallel beta-helix repeat protein